MKYILLVVFLLLSNGASSHADSPNVLFIAIDDLNDWVGCLESHPQVKTPSMDALAKRGTLFTNAHCQAPICNPSRTSVMTGLRPSTTGVYALAPWFRTVDDLKELVTLPQHFSRSGYTTYTVGKIYHGKGWNQSGVKEFVVGSIRSCSSDFCGPRCQGWAKIESTGRAVGHVSHSL